MAAAVAEEDEEGKPAGKKRGPPALARNALFEQCYRGGVVPEGEWPDFMAALRRSLPVTFRFAAAHPLALGLAGCMERDFAGDGDLGSPADFGGDEASTQASNATEEEAAGESYPCAGAQPLSRLPWLEGAWRLDLPKVVLRRAPGPKRLHGFLKRCVELGAISRQEAVSMVPAALLQGGAGLRVLDTCASPGMKTLQLLDAVAAARPLSASGADDAGAADPATLSADAVLRAGAVVANELDGRRCCMLAHHVLRVRHPAGLVIHHSALSLPPLGGGFDRVLCDVPCSGDGTIRKAPQLLAGWRPNRSNALHRLQLHIACAAAAQLRCGGRMVYSTCALSPVENEAVVAALLQRARGALELVDCDCQLPGLLRRPGLESWEVLAGSRHCKAAARLQSPAEAEERGLRVPGSAWPPAGAEAAQLGLPAALQRCWRLYPHLGDGGGFFVAVLQRGAGQLPEGFLPAGPEEAPAPAAGEAAEAAEEELPEEAVCKEALPEAQREATFVSAEVSERTRLLIEEARNFYGLDALPASNFFVRTDGDGRNVHLVSDAVRDVLNASPEIRAMIGGVRVFDENRFLKSSGCRLRLVQEGARWLAPLMRRRLCRATPDEMMKLLEGEKVLFSALEEASGLRASLESLHAQGSVVVTCELPGGSTVHAAAERGAECLSLFVNQHELKGLREVLGEHFVRARG